MLKKILGFAGKKGFSYVKPKPNVPKTDYQKSLRDLKIQVQKTKGGAAKLRQTLFESKTGSYKKEGFTFGEDKKKVTKKSKKKD